MKVVAALLLLSGCYDARVAAPCADSGVMPMAGGSAVNGLRSRDAGSNPATPTVCDDVATDAGTSGRQLGSDPSGDGSTPSPAANSCPGGIFVWNYGCTRPGDAFWQKYCGGPIVAHECYVDIHDVVSR